MNTRIIARVQTHVAMFTSVLAMLTIGAGCDQRPLSSSGISTTLKTNSFLTVLSSNSGLSLEQLADAARTTQHSTELERRLVFHNFDGNKERLLSSLRGSIDGIIESAGCKVKGFGRTDSSMTFQALDFRYSWGRNEGFIKAYYDLRSTDRVDVLIFCYEHLR